jgi:hypothetical protein
MKKVYSGKITVVERDEEDYLNLGDLEPLAKIIQDDMNYYGNYLSVRYYVYDGPEKDEHSLQEEFLNLLYGKGEAEYYIWYSEITGYLWTDERIKVGGHNLIKELYNNEGKMLWLEIDYNEKAQ